MKSKLNSKNNWQRVHSIQPDFNNSDTNLFDSFVHDWAAFNRFPVRYKNRNLFPYIKTLQLPLRKEVPQLILQTLLERNKLAVLTIEKHADGVSVAPGRANASTLMPSVNDEFQKELNIDIKYVLENMQTNAASAEDVSHALGRNMAALGFKDRVSKVNPNSVSLQQLRYIILAHMLASNSDFHWLQDQSDKT